MIHKEPPYHFWNELIAMNRSFSEIVIQFDKLIQLKVSHLFAINSELHSMPLFAFNLNLKQLSVWISSRLNQTRSSSKWRHNTSIHFLFAELKDKDVNEWKTLLANRNVYEMNMYLVWHHPILLFNSSTYRCKHLLFTSHTNEKLVSKTHDKQYAEYTRLYTMQAQSICDNSITYGTIIMKHMNEIKSRFYHLPSLCLIAL